jgi:hypothetical protein
MIEHNVLIDVGVYETVVEHQRTLRASHGNGHASSEMFFPKTCLTVLMTTAPFVGLKLSPRIFITYTGSHITC